ncbi:E3 ubiquitin-protein ligase FANCL isoform X2 [Periplaneta americana]|uniref:E3 ubiquitin-protein ligase FANCL isoform X2 n=1 Tax=Periplaneta americana TaxID=6978 RepID=UPI0037E79833
MNEQLLILKRFPLLIPENSNFTLYRGFIQVGNEEFYIRLHVPHYPDLKELSLQCSWELSVILQGNAKHLSEWTSSCSTLIAYLECLQNLIMKCLETGEVASLLLTGHRLSVDTYKRIISELESVGIDHIVQVSSLLDEIMLQAIDQASRTHILGLSLCANYPSAPPVIQADLPNTVLSNLKRSSSLPAIYKSFVQQIAALQVFWDALDELDSICWVIDPENPKRKDAYRRIMIGNNVSVQITIDPFNPMERPDIKFLGSECAVAPFQASLNEKFQWLRTLSTSTKSFSYIHGECPNCGLAISCPS